MKKNHKKPNRRLNRRTFLAGLGLGAGSLVLPSLDWARGGRGSSVVAQDSIPKRFVLFYTSHGVVRGSWRMDRPGMPTDRDTEWSLADALEDEFSPILQPLYRHRNKLIVAQGIAQTSSLADDGENNHHVAVSHLLTGAPYRVEDRPRPTAISIDQRIADAVKVEGRFASLEYGIRSGNLITREGGDVLPAQGNPRTAFDQLFPPDAMVMEPTADDRVRMERRSVLDFAAGEFDRMAPRLGADDRRKLELHRDMIRDLEARLAGLASVSCDRPAVVDGESTFESFARLSAAALACDLTRVVSIQQGQLPTAEFGAPTALDVHQDLAHRTQEGGSIAADETAEQRDARLTAYQWMTEYYRHHATQFSFLLDLLDSVPEGGGTMLDNTCVVWLTELGTGTHDLHDIPVVMAGGCQGVYRTGRYLRYVQNRPTPRRPWGAPPGVGPAHSKLLVSLAQGMGVDIDAMPMTNATGGSGENIDLTGPLEGLV